MLERSRQRQVCGSLQAGLPFVRRGQRGESRANRRTPSQDRGAPKSTRRFPHARGAAPTTKPPQKPPGSSVTVCKPAGKPATPRRHKKVRGIGGKQRDWGPLDGTKPNK